MAETKIAVLGAGPLRARLPYPQVENPGRLDGDVTGLIVLDGADLDDRHPAGVAVPWLPLRLEAGWVVIGPTVRPGRPGCARCVARRRHRNRRDGQARRELRDQNPVPVDRIPVPRPIASAVARLVAGELGADGGRLDLAVLRLSIMDGSLRRHGFLPDPACPRCSRLPDDSREAAVPERVPLPKPAPNVFRMRDLAAEADALFALYVDEETGVVAELDAARLGGVATAVARRAPGRRTHDSEHGYGRAGTYAEARLTALMEAVERIAGERPLGRRTVVHGSYRCLAADAIAPETLGTPPTEMYRLDGYELEPFSPDRKTAWVWAYSFRRDAPVLVPESVAYYGSPARPAWFHETSSGCAVGGTLDEAVLYGLLEVAERDAFLMSWYGRLPLPRVALETATDRRIPVLAETIAAELGCEVMVFAALMEQRVPAFVALAVNRTDPDRPALACAAGSHLDPERAVRSALREVGPLMYGLRARYDPAAVEPLLADPLQVRTMDQHSALYTHPAALGRLGFLLDGAARTTLPAVAAEAGGLAGNDLGKDLDRLVGRYLATGLDVLFVNTTSTELAAGGLRSVKVVVPGALPMTFGYAYRRTEGIPRLRAVAGDDPNPLPHPFS